MSTTLIDKLTALVDSGEASRSGLARAAGLHPNSLRKLGASDWNPTADTLVRLEKLLDGGVQEVLVGAEAIIDEARNGRMFILVDDDDRENEGDLIIPAQMATPDAINFMARHGRGLICLALGKERVDALGLEPMARINGTRMETAFTVSIEARDGVTTGISAADRARTIAVAIDSANGPDTIVSPGHVFPLVARPGGVLVRAGHTEAAVDVARLAGLNPSGVICEIMREDGTMARLDDLMEFAKLHGLKIGTIRDLIAYRLKKDHMVEQVAETRFISRFGGNWAARVFRDKASGEEQLALVQGAIDPSRPTLVRMHSLDLFADVLGERSERSGLLDGAMKMIEAEGSGVIVALHAAAPGSLSLSANLRSGVPAETGPALRSYGIGAQILAALGIHDMILLSNTRHSPVGLSAYGLAIVEERCIAGTEK
ncbi:MAG: 3,4-dihydroxy-2-butanone-4-phosphate synthase [Sphingomicrobium sp.]